MTIIEDTQRSMRYAWTTLRVNRVHVACNGLHRLTSCQEVLPGETVGRSIYCVMQGSRTAIDALNKMLLNELTAINQYFLHARMLRNWGLHDLGDIIYRESIGEMRHADWLIERVLFLEGLPNLQDLGRLHIGENASEILQSDLELETIARNDTVSAISLFEREGDYASRDVATKILVDSEEHVDFLERQLDLVKQLGLQNYLQSAMGPVKNQSSA